MQPKYCAAPWRGLHINFRGEVKTCCAGKPKLLGDLNKNTIQEIIHSPYMREIREIIKSGRLHPEYCYACIQSERYGRSERHWHNDVNQEFDVSLADIDHFDPTIIDIRWNNTCNLSCNYCNEFCSTKWLSIKKSTPVKNAVRPYYEQVCEFIQHHATDIREVAMVGGEPLLLPENETLLDAIPPQCIVTLITNMNVDFDRNKIVHKLQTRTRVGWSMSFENIADRFEYVRHGGSWRMLNYNIDRVKNLMVTQGHWGGIHAVYNIYNCTRLVDFRQWTHDRELTVLWQTLYYPEYLDPLQHNKRLRTMAQTEAQHLLDSCGSYMDPLEISFFENVVKNMEKTPGDEDRCGKLLRQHIDDIENLYHPDSYGKFVQLWPELAFMVN